jgi:hypothetical protein
LDFLHFRSRPQSRGFVNDIFEVEDRRALHRGKFNGAAIRFGGKKQSE